MAQDLRTLCQDIGTIFEVKKSITLLELAKLTEEKPDRLKAVMDLLMLGTGIELTGTTYTYTPKKKEAIVLYAVFAADPIDDAFYFNPEEPSPTAAEIAEKKFMAAFQDEDAAFAYAGDYGFQVLRIEESGPEEDDERLLVI